MTHICVSELTIIGLDNGLSPCRCQAIIWSNAGILPVRTIRTHFSEILNEIQTFSFNEMHLKCRLRNVGHFVSALMCWSNSPSDVCNWIHPHLLCYQLKCRRVYIRYPKYSNKFIGFLWHGGSWLSADNSQIMFRSHVFSNCPARYFNLVFIHVSFGKDDTLATLIGTEKRLWF